MNRYEILLNKKPEPKKPESKSETIFNELILGNRKSGKTSELIDRFYKNMTITSRACFYAHPNQLKELKKLNLYNCDVKSYFNDFSRIPKDRSIALYFDEIDPTNFFRNISYFHNRITATCDSKIFLLYLADLAKNDIQFFRTGFMNIREYINNNVFYIYNQRWKLSEPNKDFQTFRLSEPTLIG